MTNIQYLYYIYVPILYIKLKNFITDRTLLQSKRQPQNLKRLLTKAQFNSNSPRTFEVRKCGDKRCGTCAYIHTGSEITLDDGRKIYTNADMNCKSENLIYCIQCTNCNKSYIGQTSNALKQRMKVHRQQIRDPQYRKIPLSQHLDTCSGGLFKIFPFYKMKTSSDVLREIKEKNFIRKFKPILNGHS